MPRLESESKDPVENETAVMGAEEQGRGSRASSHSCGCGHSRAERTNTRAFPGPGGRWGSDAGKPRPPGFCRCPPAPTGHVGHTPSVPGQAVPPVCTSGSPSSLSRPPPPPALLPLWARSWHVLFKHARPSSLGPAAKPAGACENKSHITEVLGRRRAVPLPPPPSQPPALAAHPEDAPVASAWGPFPPGFPPLFLPPHFVWLFK